MKTSYAKEIERAQLECKRQAGFLRWGLLAQVVFICVLSLIVQGAVYAKYEPRSLSVPALPTKAGGMRVFENVLIGNCADAIPNNVKLKFVGSLEGFKFISGLEFVRTVWRYTKAIGNQLFTFGGPWKLCWSDFICEDVASYSGNNDGSPAVICRADSDRWNAAVDIARSYFFKFNLYKYSGTLRTNPWWLYL
jgi:hypothetical protein